MSSSAVWVDSEHAKIFKFVNGKVARHEIKNTQPIHHTHNMKEDTHYTNRFYHELAEYLEKHADELILVGPGVSKKHFESHIKKHHKTLAKKIVEVKSLHAGSDSYIIEESRKILQKAHLFAKS